MRGFQNCACGVVAADTEGAGEKQGDQKRENQKVRTKRKDSQILVKKKKRFWGIRNKTGEIVRPLDFCDFRVCVEEKRESKFHLFNN